MLLILCAYIIKIYRDLISKIDKPARIRENVLKVLQPSK